MADDTRPSPEEIILYDKDPATKIATITFNRPDYLNAPTSEARLRYADLLRAANVDDDVKVVVIRGVGDNSRQRRRPAGLLRRRRGCAAGRACASRTGRDLSAAGVVPHGATMGQWYANVAAGNRALQELKKISIVEAKGYCYGWHFYQCADADLVIASTTRFSAIPRSATTAGARACGPGF
jgi:enoyl-CoA hydratase/carnithine racemase